MLRFIVGVIVGVIAATWLQRTQNQELLDRRLGEMHERANAVLLESRRILEETRREFSAAVESGRRSVETTAERWRRPAGGEDSATDKRAE